MNATVIHNDNRVAGGIWLHIVKKSLDEMSEAFDTVGTFDNLAVNNTVQREGWKD